MKTFLQGSVQGFLLLTQDVNCQSLRTHFLLQYTRYFMRSVCLLSRLQPLPIFEIYTLVRGDVPLHAEIHESVYDCSV